MKHETNPLNCLHPEELQIVLNVNLSAVVVPAVRVQACDRLYGMITLAGLLTCQHGTKINDVHQRGMDLLNAYIVPEAKPLWELYCQELKHVCAEVQEKADGKNLLEIVLEALKG